MLAQAGRTPAVEASHTSAWAGPHTPPEAASRAPAEAAGSLAGPRARAAVADREAKQEGAPERWLTRRLVHDRISMLPDDVARALDGSR
jgi:hypothetical protein